MLIQPSHCNTDHGELEIVSLLPAHGELCNFHGGGRAAAKNSQP